MESKGTDDTLHMYRNDLNRHILCMFQVTFLIDAAHISVLIVSFSSLVVYDFLFKNEKFMP